VLTKGVDLSQVQISRRLKFLDATSNLFSGLKQDPTLFSFTSQNPSIAQLADAILNGLGDFQGSRPSLFLEGLDFLLAAGENEVSPIQILSLISSLSDVYLS
jgi:hypothetical protein